MREETPAAFSYAGADDCYLETGSYQNNGRLALMVESWTQGPMAILTVNLPEYDIREYEAFIDTNNCPGAGELIERLGIGHDTGKTGKSGYCTYPIYSFNRPYLYTWTAQRGPRR